MAKSFERSRLFNLRHYWRGVILSLYCPVAFASDGPIKLDLNCFDPLEAISGMAQPAPAKSKAPTASGDRAGLALDLLSELQSNEANALPSPGFILKTMRLLLKTPSRASDYIEAPLTLSFAIVFRTVFPDLQNLSSEESKNPIRVNDALTRPSISNDNFELLLTLFEVVGKFSTRSLAGSASPQIESFPILVRAMNEHLVKAIEAKAPTKIPAARLEEIVDGVLRFLRHPAYGAKLNSIFGEAGITDLANVTGFILEMYFLEIGKEGRASRFRTYTNAHLRKFHPGVIKQWEVEEAKLTVRNIHVPSEPQASKTNASTSTQDTPRPSGEKKKTRASAMDAFTFRQLQEDLIQTQPWRAYQSAATPEIANTSPVTRVDLNGLEKEIELLTEGQGRTNKAYENFLEWKKMIEEHGYANLHRPVHPSYSAYQSFEEHPYETIPGSRIVKLGYQERIIFMPSEDSKTVTLIRLVRNHKY